MALFYGKPYGTYRLLLLFNRKCPAKTNLYIFPVNPLFLLWIANRTRNGEHVFFKKTLFLTQKTGGKKWNNREMYKFVFTRQLLLKRKRSLYVPYWFPCYLDRQFWDYVHCVFMHWRKKQTHNDIGWKMKDECFLLA